MKQRFNILKQKSFLLFLVIAAAMWYVNKLAYTYKTEVVIPIELTFDFHSLGWVENPKMDVRCLVEGNGSELLKYGLGIAPIVSIPTGSLVINNTAKENFYQISDASLREALRIGLNNMQVLQIIDTISWIHIDRMEDAVLPIISNVQIDCEKQFMIAGQIKLQPSEINVRAPRSILDTLRYIQTKELSYTNMNKSLNVGVDLIIPHGVISSQKQTRVITEIVGYTELEYDLKIRADNLPVDMSMICVPEIVKVLIKVPLKSFKSDDVIIPTVTIDYKDREKMRSTFFKIKVGNLPVDGVVTSVKPEFVESFFQKN